MFIVYGLFSEDQIFYVGKTTEERLSLRLSEHKCRAGRQNNQKIYNKIRKLIRTSKDITIKVLHSTEDEKEQSDKEIELIAAYGRDTRKGGLLYNSTDGGEGITGHVYTAESRKKMSDSKKGHKYLVGKKRPDMVDRFSKKVYAYDMDGKFIAEYSSQREAAKQLGMDYKLINNSIKLVGRTWCGQRNEYLRFRLDNPNELEVFERKIQGIKVAQYDLTGNLLTVYNNAHQASKAIGKHPQNIRDACNGRYKTTYGYIWKFVD